MLTAFIYFSDKPHYLHTRELFINDIMFLCILYLGICSWVQKETDETTLGLSFCKASGRGAATESISFGITTLAAFGAPPQSCSWFSDPARSLCGFRKDTSCQGQAVWDCEHLELHTVWIQNQINYLF